MKPTQNENPLKSWLSERFPVEKLNYDALVVKKVVPIHHMSWAYYLGGLVLLFFTIQIITGLLLLLFYQPTVNDALASVRLISEHVPAGALIRNLHAWSASCMIGAVLAHFITTFVMKAFGRPREITWLAGGLLLLLTFAFGFTGYLLPWNQISVNATKVVLQSIEQVGNYLPPSLAQLPTQVRVAIQGEPTIGQATLSRFFAVHVVILPLLLLLVLGLHLLSIQIHGISPGVDTPARKYEKFVPLYLLKDLRVWVIAFCVLFLLARCLPFDAFSPFPLLQPYNPIGATPPGIKPEWYFYPVYYPMEILPFWAVMLGMGFLTLLVFLIPWVFRNASRVVLRVLGITYAAYLLVIIFGGHGIYMLVKGGK